MNKPSSSRNLYQRKENGKNRTPDFMKNFIKQLVNESVNEKLKEKNNAPTINITSLDPDITTFLPMSTEAEFQEFENKLKNNLSRNQSLAVWYDQKIMNEVTVKSSVNIIMLSTLKKDLAILYSGTGKRSKNGVKKNFSSTETFKCLHAVIKQKFPDCEREHSLAGQVGLWLARAFGRRGRTQRSSRTKKNA